MSRIVAGLEAAGLVARAPHPSDARSSLIAATPAGRELLVAGQQRRVGVIEERLRELSPEELAALERAIGALERVSRGT